MRSYSVIEGYEKPDVTDSDREFLSNFKHQMADELAQMNNAKKERALGMLCDRVSKLQMKNKYQGFFKILLFARIEQEQK